LLLAVITKYAGMLFIPTVLFILFWQTRQGRGWLQALLRVGLVLPSFLAAGLGVLTWQGDEFLSGLSYTTTNRVAFIQTAALELAGRAAGLGGILVLLALVGLLAQSRKHLPLNLVLIATGLSYLQRRSGFAAQAYCFRPFLSGTSGRLCGLALERIRQKHPGSPSLDG